MPGGDPDALLEAQEIFGDVDDLLGLYASSRSRRGEGGEEDEEDEDEDEFGEGLDGEGGGGRDEEAIEQRRQQRVRVREGLQAATHVCVCKGFICSAARAPALKLNWLAA